MPAMILKFFNGAFTAFLQSAGILGIVERRQNDCATVGGTDGIPNRRLADKRFFPAAGDLDKAFSSLLQKAAARAVFFMCPFFPALP